MKKTIAVLTLCAAISCAACSCGGKSSDSSSETTTAASAEKESSETEASSESSRAYETADKLRLAASSALMDLYSEGTDVSGKYTICADPSKNVGLDKINADELYKKIDLYSDDISKTNLLYVIYCENGMALDAAIALNFDTDEAVEAGEKATGKTSLAEIYAYFNE